MNLKQHNDNRFSKEKTEMESYLLRIIQRYFEIESTYERETIESIIVESLTRLKRDLLHYSGFIYSLNEMTGHIVLTIKDFGGEKAFDKNSAFNKDFGIDADTICEGNDPRLSDQREPNEHVHVIDDINELKDQIMEINLSTTSHAHANKNVLDMLIYTGKQTKIDLIMLENLQEATNNYYEHLSFKRNELNTIKNNQLEVLSTLLNVIQEYFENAINVIQDATDWLNNAYEYTHTKVIDFRDDTLNKLTKYVSKEDFQELMDYLNKGYQLLVDGELPIPDGELVFVPTEEVIEDTPTAEEGDSLKTIYDEGLRLGTDDWAWNNTTSSFVFQSNSDYSAMFISLKQFSKYTHRVTLSSINGDDDVIGSVIAYDETSGLCLSVCCQVGGWNSSFSSIWLSVGNQSIGSNKVVSDINIGESHSNNTVKLNGWADISNGITLLIKKDNNIVNVYCNFNTKNTWFPVTLPDGTLDIIPTETPIITYDLSIHPEFINKACNYGYCCQSQALSTYGDVWFVGYGVSYNEISGSTIINSVNNFKFTPYTPTAFITKGKPKLYFRYDEEGITKQASLPFLFTSDTGKTLVIQASFTKDNQIFIETNCINAIDMYVTEDNLYDEDTIICATAINKDSYGNLALKVKDQNGEICLIKDSTKNDFVVNLLQDNREYYIQGNNLSLDDDINFFDDNDNAMTFMDWDKGEPVMNCIINQLYLNKNKKWAAGDGLIKRGYVAEFKIQRISNYFDNPRIYYQVFGSKEE